MSIDDLIDQFVEDLDFDVLLCWADILGIGHEEETWLKDEWLDREDELRVLVAEAMGKVGKPPKKE